MLRTASEDRGESGPMMDCKRLSAGVGFFEGFPPLPKPMAERGVRANKSNLNVESIG